MLTVTFIQGEKKDIRKNMKTRARKGTRTSLVIPSETPPAKAGCSGSLVCKDSMCRRGSHAPAAQLLSPLATTAVAWCPRGPRSAMRAGPASSPSPLETAHVQPQTPAQPKEMREATVSEKGPLPKKKWNQIINLSVVEAFKQLGTRVKIQQ